MFQLLLLARQISRETAGAFDPTSGPLIALWRACRGEGRIPTADEIAGALAVTGMSHVHFDEAEQTVRFDRPGVELNLGAIGKGHAVDRAAAFLVHEGVDEWLFHGGYSSVLVRGDHCGYGGWPVGIRNPLLPHERLATIVLKDQSLSTSGSNVQYFRHAGKRYGHIVDPRTGWPAEELLSVTVHRADGRGGGRPFDRVFRRRSRKLACVTAIIIRRSVRFSFVRPDGAARWKSSFAESRKRCCFSRGT